MENNENCTIEALLAKLAEHQSQLRKAEERACLYAIGSYAGMDAALLTAEELRKRATLHHWPDGTKTFFWDDTPLLRFIPAAKQEPVLVKDEQEGMYTLHFPGLSIERLYTVKGGAQ